MDDNSLFHFKELQHNLAAAESVQREIEVMIQGSAGPPLSSSSSSRSSLYRLLKNKIYFAISQKIEMFLIIATVSLHGHMWLTRQMPT